MLVYQRVIDFTNQHQALFRCQLRCPSQRRASPAAWPCTTTRCWWPTRQARCRRRARWWLSLLWSDGYRNPWYIYIFNYIIYIFTYYVLIYVCNMWWYIIIINNPIMLRWLGEWVRGLTVGLLLLDLHVHFFLGGSKMNNLELSRRVTEILPEGFCGFKYFIWVCC